MQPAVERRSTIRRSRDQLKTDEYVRELESQNKRLTSLINVSRELMQEVHLDRLLELIMEKVTEVMNAERSSLFLLDHKTDELYARIAQGLNAKEIRFPNGKGIAGHAGKTGQTINIKDAYDDPRFNRDFDRKSGFRTKAILCMPIKNSRGKIIGVSQVLNKHDSTGVFTRDDEVLLEAFSSIAAISLENAFAYETISHTMQVFEKFVPARYLASIARQGIESIRVGNAEQVEIAILFCDIRGFTTTSEKMKPGTVLSFLNEYLTRMNAPIAAHGGFVDKFIGDAIMAIFDSKTPVPAVRAAVGMMRELDSYNRERKKRKEPVVHIGIGLHYGRAVMGTVGSESRMDSTVIGDSVNLAARLEGLTKKYSCGLLVSEDIARKLPPRSFHVREIDRVRVKGKTRAIGIFEIYDYESPALIKQKTQSRKYLEGGIALYKKKKFGAALELFEKGRKLCPKDPVFDMHMKRSQAFAENGAPPGFDGAILLTEK